MRPPELERALAMYRLRVEQSEALMPAELVAGASDGSSGVLPLRDVPVDSPRDALDLLAYGVKSGALEPLQWVLFACEGWTAESSAPGDLDSLEPGELGSRKAIGMAGVGEALMVHFAHANGDTWSVTQAFERKVALGAVAWGEVHVMTEYGRDITGAVPDALAILVGLEVRADAFEEHWS